jgi:hypothetical protein
MSFADYVSVCVQLYCVGSHCLSLHVSASMAIFKCVGYLYFYMPEGFCLAKIVKDSENQHNKTARRRKHNLQNPSGGVADWRTNRVIG